MSYVYKNNAQLDASLKAYMENHACTEDELLLYIKNNPDSFCVFDNIYSHEHERMKGFDSIGCAIYCGIERVERIIWCGSVLDHTDPNIHPNFTPTITQVAAGVLSGLSYLLEPTTPFGLYEPCDLNTDYMIRKSKSLLGQLVMTDIPVHHVPSLDIQFSVRPLR